MSRMKRVIHAILITAALLAVMPSLVQAQEPPEHAFVIKSGAATVFTPPTHAVFWIHRTVTADSLKLALEESTKIDPAIREALTLKELRPTTLETSTPTVVSMEENTVRVSTELRFSMSAFAAGESAMIRFGELCEHLKDIAGTVAGELSGPNFVTTEKAKVIQDAVKEASKEAYQGVAGAAEALNATVRAVDMIEVGDIVWNSPPDTEATFPTVSQIACTATVKVTYILDYH